MEINNTVNQEVNQQTVREQGKTFTQEEVNRIVQERLLRARQDTATAETYRQERDDARRELEEYKNNAFLRNKGIREEDLDYVMFKVGKLMNENTDFQQATATFLKENPRYAGGYNYRVSTSSGANSNGSSGGTNIQVDNPEEIRKAMGLKG